MYSKNKQVFNILLYLLIFFLFFLDYFFTVNFSRNGIVNFTFFIIGISSIIAICIAPKFISIFKMFCAFIFLFFYYTAFKQYTDGVTPWSLILFADIDYIKANLIIIISEYIVFFVYLFKKNNTKIVLDENKFTLTKLSLQLLTLISIIVVIYFFMVDNLFSRVGESSDTIMSSVQKILRFIPASVLLIYINSTVKYKWQIKYIAVIAITYFILFLPVSGAISRFLLFGAYLILVIRPLSKLKITAIFPIILLMCFIIVLPAFNFFKHNTIMDLGKFNYLDYGFNYKAVDFDAYEMLMETMKYSSVEGYSYGNNVISSIIFFIPRSIWNGKSLPTGEVISSYYGAFFTNLSCPYIAEFYFSGGILGAVLLSLVLGIIISKLDNWLFSKSLSKVGYASIVGGIVFYWLRGAMLPCTAYLFSLIISFYLVITFVKMCNYKK